MGRAADRADRHSKHHRLVLARFAQRDELRPRFVWIIAIHCWKGVVIGRVWTMKPARRTLQFQSRPHSPSVVNATPTIFPA